MMDAIVSGNGRSWHSRRAYSLLEMLAVVMILGIVAALVLPRFTGSNREADRNACYTIQGNIEIQVQLWRRHHGSWPASDLNDIGADPMYFPEGIPRCPVDGSSYTIDAEGMIVGHVH
ncbi:MAG: type II secretion system protein [Pirellulales bacterium]|nr:type II secretion system protein [Pirellulales bacterium]